jgi:hypothetical protein
MAYSFKTKIVESQQPAVACKKQQTSDVFYEQEQLGSNHCENQAMAKEGKAGHRQHKSCLRK